MFRILYVLFAPSVFPMKYPVDKGSYLLGGTLGLSSHGSDSSALEDYGDRITQALLNMSFRYFVLPGFALGVTTLLESTKRGACW